MAEENVKQPELQSFTIWEREYKTLYTKKFSNRKKYEAADPKKVLSFIPGVIQEIFVKKGQKVKKGDPMLILESMKMMNKVLVPIDGTIKHINVISGEKIPKDYLMVEFE